MDFINRRKYPRLNGPFQIDLLNMGDDPTVSQWEVVVPGEGLDVSKGGMRIRCDYNVAIGCFLSVILYFKGQGSVCLCEAVWKREENGHKVYGLFIREWSKLDPALASNLNNLEVRTSAASAPSLAVA